jgi:Luciferase-like monooxygenase
MIAPDRLALGIEPNSSLSVLDMMECAQLAEKKGVAATWVAEGRRGEVFALLSALAMGTSRIGSGPGFCRCSYGALGSLPRVLRRSTKSPAVASCWASAPATRV